jgi:hypothetical protein
MSRKAIRCGIACFPGIFLTRWAWSPVLIRTELRLSVLTRFLYANRSPLRSKTL